MQFNLVHVIPDPRAHGLYGLAEVMESVRWGLTELGHTVTLKVNQIGIGARNIIFGFQMLLPEVLEKLPEDTVVYNLDQMANCEPSQLREEVAVAAKDVRLVVAFDAEVLARVVLPEAALQLALHLPRHRLAAGMGRSSTWISMRFTLSPVGGRMVASRKRLEV